MQSKYKAERDILLVSTVFDSNNPELGLNYKDLLLKLEHAVEFHLPNGRPTTGILKDVTVLDGGPLIELTLEIDDRHMPIYQYHGMGWN